MFDTRIIQESFTTLLMGLFFHNPYIDIRHLPNVTQEAIQTRYGINFQHGLVTFSQLSGAEQAYLLHYLQK